MIVTIDGPAGAGKSTIAKQLAQKLGFAFLDTGAMYRTIALAGLQAKCDLADQQQLASIASKVSIRFHQDQVLLNDMEVTQTIRTPEVTQVTKFAANNNQVREILVKIQREFAQNQQDQYPGLVSEGRDQGTIVFPKAHCKIFLTASPEERARRRVTELENKGTTLKYEEVLQQLNQRDHEDINRSWGALIQAEDAVKFSTDGLTPVEVIEGLFAIVDQARQASS